MSELAITPPAANQGAGRQLPVIGAVERITGWWLACAGSPFDPSQTAGVTVAPTTRPPCNMTGIASGAGPYPIKVSAAVLGILQATEILPTLTDEPAIKLIAANPFVNAQATLGHDPRYELSYALVIARPLAPIAHGESVSHSRRQTLRDLLRSTGGSAELAAETLGASRRSIYNWLKGKPLRSEFATRAARLQGILAPLRQDWHPEALSDWLQTGEPSPVELAAQERWLELEERVRDVLQPLQPQAESVELRGTGSAESWPTSALGVVLQEFNSPPPARARETKWHPRELTGVAPEPEEE